MASRDDLEETCELVRAAGGAVCSAVVDVRDFETLDAGGRRRASRRWAASTSSWPTPGSRAMRPGHEISEAAWQEMIDINLTGTWHTSRPWCRT